MTIKKRLLAGILLTAISILVIVSLGIYVILDIKSSISLLTDKSTPAQVKTMELQQTVEKISADFMRLGLAAKPEEIKTVSKAIDGRVKVLQETLAELDRLGVSEHAMDPAVFTTLHLEIVRATQQRLKDAETFRTETGSVNASLQRVNDIMSNVGKRASTVNGQASKKLVEAQNANVHLNNTIKKMLTLQNKLKELELLLNDLEGVKNKFRLTPLKEKARTIADSVRGTIYREGEPSIIKEVKDQVGTLYGQITAESKGLIALRGSVLAGNTADESSYLAQKKEIQHVVETLNSRMFEAIDPIEVQLVKDKTQMDEAMGFQKGTGSVSSISSSISIKVKEMSDHAKLIMLADNEGELQKALNNVISNQGAIYKEAGILKQLLSTMKQTSLIREVDSGLAAVKEATGAIERIAKAKRSAIASEADLKKAVETVKNVSMEQSKRGEEQVRSISEKQQIVVAQVSNTVKTAMAVMAGLSFAIIIIMLLITGKTASTVSRSIKTAEELITTVSGGDFTKQVRIDTNDEIGSMCGDMNGLVDKLCHSLTGISDKATIVATAVADQVATVDKLSERATGLADEAGILSTSGEELSASITDVANNAKSTSDFANSAHDTAVKGSEIISEAIKGIEAVSQSAKGMSATLQDLAESSQRVGNVVITIEDIAEQTNLLALNAAIEAARAGDQGRGFAVVADEVKKLAEKTSTSTFEITEIIKSIQSNAVKVGEAINSEIDKINAVVSLAGKSSEALEGIVSSMERICTMSQQIAVSSEEQTQVVDSIAMRVLSVSNTASDFSHGIGEISKASGDLKKVASELHNLTSQFKVV